MRGPVVRVVREVLEARVAPEAWRGLPEKVEPAVLRARPGQREVPGQRGPREPVGLRGPAARVGLLVPPVAPAAPAPQVARERRVMRASVLSSRDVSCAGAVGDAHPPAMFSERFARTGRWPVASKENHGAD